MVGRTRAFGAESVLVLRCGAGQRTTVVLTHSQPSRSSATSRWWHARCGSARS